jgi:hypothetical protein
MNRRELKRIGRFVAKSSDGEAHDIDVFQEWILLAIQGGTSRMMGSKRYLLGSQPVNRLEEGKYLVVQTGEILTSNDPDAS